PAALEVPMRNLFGRLLLVSLFVVSIAWLAQATESGMTTNANEEAIGENCERHFNVSYDGMKVFHAQEDRTIPKASISKLHVYGLHNGGIQVQGWDRDDIFIRACKGAAAYDQGEAQSLLDAMKLDVKGGDVTVSGLEHDRAWCICWCGCPKRLPCSLKPTTARLACETSPRSRLKPTRQMGRYRSKTAPAKSTLRSRTARFR